jgi:hypothetical protein
MNRVSYHTDPESYFFLFLLFLNRPMDWPLILHLSPRLRGNTGPFQSRFFDYLYYPESGSIYQEVLV